MMTYSSEMRSKISYHFAIFQGSPPRYTSTFQTLRLIYREEGLSACYKGFVPKAIRMGLGGAVAMSTFELVQYIAA